MKWFSFAASREITVSLQALRTEIRRELLYILGAREKKSDRILGNRYEGLVRPRILGFYIRGNGV
jgi:hypothetical protein